MGWSDTSGPAWAEAHPRAGGPDHVASFIEKAEGFAFELVAAPDIAE